MKAKDTEQLTELLRRLANEIDEDYADRIDKTSSLKSVDHYAETSESMIEEIQRVVRWARRYQEPRTQRGLSNE